MDSEERLQREVTRACTLAMMSGADPEDVAMCLLRLAGELAALPVEDEPCE